LKLRIFFNFLNLILLSLCLACGGSTDGTVSGSGTSVPAAPTGFSATAGNGQLSLSWTAVGGASSYSVYYGTSTGVTKANGTKISGITTNSYTQTGLTNYTPYYYIVTASNDAGEGDASSETSAYPLSYSKVFVYALEGGGTIRPFLMDQSSGALTAGTDVSTASSSTNLSGDASAKFLFSLRYNSSLSKYQIYPFTINQTTGALTLGSLTNQADLTGPFSVSGSYLYAPNWHDDDIIIYSINQSSADLSASTTVSTGSGSSPPASVLSPDGAYLYVLAPGLSYLKAYSVNSSSGNLTLSSLSSTPSSSMGLVISPSGSLIYVYTASALRPFTVSGSTVSAGSDISVSSSPDRAVFSGNSAFLFIRNSSSTVIRYAVNSSSGALSGATQVLNSVTAMGADPTGRFLYTWAGTSIVVYSINQSTGALTQAATATGPSNPVYIFGTGIPQS